MTKIVQLEIIFLKIIIWIFEKIKLLNDTAKYLNKILKKRGRIIIEFYPKDDKELKVFKNSFINNGFEGYMVKNKPSQKSGQTFLLLRKKS